MEDRRKLVIIGIVGILILFVAMYLFNTVRKTPTMSRRTSVRAEFRKISSLKQGSEVFFNGLLVGKVDDIYLKKDQSKMIVVNFSFNPGVKIPITAEAVSYVPSPLATAYLLLNFNTSRIYNPDVEEDWLSEGDVIPGVIGSYLLDGRNLVDPMIRKFDTLVLQAFPGKDSIRQIVKDIEASIQRVENSSKAFRTGVYENKNFVLSLMNQIDKITMQIKKSEDSINLQIADLAKTTTTLKADDISKKIPKIDPEAFKIPDFAAINTQVVKIKDQLTKINNGEDSTLNRLMNDVAFKNSIINKINQIGCTLDTIRRHPERYVSLRAK